MNFKLSLTLLLFFISLTFSYASFPVERTVKTTITKSTDQLEEVNESNDYVLTSPAVKAGNDKWVGVALWFFLGVFAAHRWYYGKPAGWNILFILTLGGLGIWAIIDLINMLTDKW